MTPPIITEHKGEIGFITAGAGIGAIAGNAAYKKAPSEMVKYIREDGNAGAYITNKYIDYAKKVSIKDCYNQVDPHTKRQWLKKKVDTVKKQAATAKSTPNSDERNLLQKTYDLGIEFLTNRKNVSAEDEILAKRGANAILYGRKVEKHKYIAKYALIGALIGFAGKKIYEKYKELKFEGKDFKDILPKKDELNKNNWHYFIFKGYCNIHLPLCTVMSKTDKEKQNDN